MHDEYEPGDLFDNRHGLALAAGGVALMVVLGFGVAWLVKIGADVDEQVAGLGDEQAAGAPIDEVTAVRLAAEAAWAARAQAWEWVDRDAGVARIPVERAAQLRLARGFPTRPGSGLAPSAGGGP